MSYRTTNRWVTTLALLLLLPVSVAFATPSTGPEAELRDPTRPPAAPRRLGAAAERRSHWSLNSILVGEERRVAVVNDATVVVGDVIDGARVVAIEPHQVMLRVRRTGAAVALTVTPPSVRVPVVALAEPTVVASKRVDPVAPAAGSSAAPPENPADASNGVDSNAVPGARRDSSESGGMIEPGGSDRPSEPTPRAEAERRDARRPATEASDSPVDRPASDRSTSGSDGGERRRELAWGTVAS